MEQNWIDTYRPNFEGLEAHIFSEPHFKERLNLVIQEIYGNSSRVTGITATEIEPDFYEITMTGSHLCGSGGWTHFFYNPLEKYAFVDEWQGKWVITPDNEKMEIPEIRNYALSYYDHVLLVQKGKDAVSEIEKRRRLEIASYELRHMEGFDRCRFFTAIEIDRRLKREAERRSYVTYI
jgi:hypothetical protein